MRITEYNSDGSIKEVRNYNEPLPDYLTSFDDNHSFLNISDIDIEIVSQRKNSFEKNLVLERMRNLISFDYKNYLNSISNNEEDTIQFVDSFSGDTVIDGRWDSKDELLASLLRYYNKQYNSSDISEIEDLLSSLVANCDLIEVVLYHTCKYYNYFRGLFIFDDHFHCYRSFLRYIHQIYYVLKRYFGFDSNFKLAHDIIHAIHPYATMTFSKSHLPIINDDQMVIRIMETLFQNEGQRRDVYRLLHTLQSLFSRAEQNGESHHYLAMVNERGNNNTGIIPANPSNGVETTMIELTPEEVVSLNVQCEASEEQIKHIQENLQKEFNKYSVINGDVLKNSTDRRAVHYNRLMEPTQLSSKNWFMYYHYYLDQLEEGYSKHEQKNGNLDCPYYYYYLLVDLCDICKRYEFNGDFLKALVNRAINQKCIGRKDLYEQMFRLNYIEESAELIKSDCQDSEDSNNEFEMKREKELRNLYEELSNGENGDIVKQLKNGEFELTDSIDAVKYFMVFLTPIFTYKEYYNNETNKVKEKIEKVLRLESVSSRLLDNHKKKVVKHNLNIKFVLNIIGYLSDLGKENNNNIINSRQGFRLEKDLIYLWKLKGAGSYHKYVSGYDKYSTGRTLSESMKIEIESVIRK